MFGNFNRPQWVLTAAHGMKPSASVNTLGTPDPSNLEFVPGQSDSGAGFFIDGKLVGVHSDRSTQTGKSSRDRDNSSIEAD